MCQSLRKFYKCGHSEVISRDCAKKDTGMKNWLGQQKACPKEIKIQYEDSFICGVCTAKTLEKLDSDTQASNLMILLLRNEKYLKQRALARDAYVEPVLDLSTPTAAEIEMLCCANDEFLARRERRCGMVPEERYLEYLDLNVVLQGADRGVGDFVGFDERSPFSVSSSSSSASFVSLEDTIDVLDTLDVEETLNVQETWHEKEDLDVGRTPYVEEGQQEKETHLTEEAQDVVKIQDVEDTRDMAEPKAFRTSALTFNLPIRPAPHHATLPPLPATTYTPTTHLIPLHSTSGRALLTHLRTFLSLPPTHPPHKIHTFLHRNPSILTSITHDTIPLHPSHPSTLPLTISISAVSVGLNADFDRAFQSLDWDSYMAGLKKHGCAPRPKSPAPLGIMETGDSTDVGAENPADDDDLPGPNFDTSLLRPSRCAPWPPRRPSPLRQVTTLTPPLPAPLPTPLRISFSSFPAYSPSPSSPPSPPLSPTPTLPLPLHSHHTPPGTAHLRTIRRCLNLSDYFSAQDVAEFIVRNEEYVARVRDGRIEMPVGGEQDRERVRAELEVALGGLDWGEIAEEVV